MSTDKQLLQMTKLQLVSIIRELEHELANEMNTEAKTIIVEKELSKPKTSYVFGAN